MAAISSNVFRKIKMKGHEKENEVEIRDDQEQLAKLQEIIDILVAAGYFRARIKGLSSFDKVVGGMTWCIELCNIDVDVDLLFQENSTIGQKIALTEKIVAVLPKLKCPHAIEPHQIQGLDFIHIYPVIQWLVKRSMENREEISSFVRSYAVNQFNKQFETEAQKPKNASKILESLNAVEEVYKPHRYYKRKTAPPPDINSRVQITLLEYGYNGDTRGTQAGTQKGLEHKDLEQLHVQQLADEMIAAKEELVHYDDLNSEEKENVNSHYVSLHKELKDGGVKCRLEDQLHMLRERKILMNDEYKKLESHQIANIEELNLCEKRLQEIEYQQQEADNALKESVSDENPVKVKEIEDLVRLNEDLKNREIQFREQCKKELAELEQLIESTKAAKTKSQLEENPQLIHEINEETEKIRLLRLQLAKKNRHVYAIQRKLDDIPSRAELAQYQKRFLELYNQVSAKHKETKQYYTLYNTLEDKRLYMQKELSIMNSISENYPEAMRNSASKEEFITQFQNILDNVSQSKLKVEQKLTEVKQERQNISLFLQNLIEQQRKYVAAIRQLSIECGKHEALSAQRLNSQSDN